MAFKKSFFFLITLTLSCVLCLYVSSSFAAERVVVVGDSITGHSMNLPYGFTHEIRAALSESNSDVEFVPLGGSGQTIFSWRNIIANSYDNNQRLDIEGIFVKDEFDKGADTILIHLGMNDALQPSIKSNEEGFASWKKEYANLVADLRKRVPGVKRVVLTPPTMLTEEVHAFKNILMDRFADIIKEVAEETNCEFEDTRSEFKRFVTSVRLLDPNFRFTLDFVHPNQFGHQVMSWSFLKGLGLDAIAQKYYETKISSEIRDFSSPGMSLAVCDKTQDAPFNIDDVVFDVLVDTRAIPEAVGVENVHIKSCGNLKVNSIKKSDVPGQFVVELSGSTADFPADLDVQIGSVERVLPLNAPYFVATGFVLADGATFSTPENYPKDKALTEIDQAVLDGKDPLKVDGYLGRCTSPLSLRRGRTIRTPSTFRLSLRQTRLTGLMSSATSEVPKRNVAR